MTSKWKYNNTKGKYKTHGEDIFNAEAGCVVGQVFAGSSEIVAEVVSNIAESSDEVQELLDNL